MASRQPSLWILHALLSHWWRHPVQLGTLIVGLIAATALWSGVQALNQQARMSYDQAAARFNSVNQAHIMTQSGAPVSQADYLQLRRLGWPVTPLIEGSLSPESSLELPESFQLLGIDPLTLIQSSPNNQNSSGLPETLSLNTFLSPPWEVWLSPSTAEKLKPWIDKAQPPGFPYNPDGEMVTFKRSDSLADNELITDIYLAQYWQAMPKELTRLLILDSDFTAPLPKHLANELRIIMPQSDHDISRLTGSFHLNLTALSLLAFLVGLLMVYSAIHLALNQRLPLRRILYSCGVSQRQLLGWLIAELLLLSGIIAIPGLLAGYWIAAMLLPDVSASLAGLYGAQVSGELQLNWRWWQQGVLMAWGGTLIAAILPIIKLVSKERALSAYAIPSVKDQHRLKWVSRFGVFLTLIAAVIAITGESLSSGFLLLACILASAALLLPALLDGLLALGQRHARSVIGQWLWADARLQVPQLAVALVALLLALSTSIGVGGMVDGFRNTFTGWLDQRLAAEVYLRSDNEKQAKEITQWLSHHPDVSAILPSSGSDTQLNGIPIELRSIQVHSTYTDHWPILSAEDNFWNAIEHHSGVMINEQLSRQLSLDLGDSISLSHEQESALTIVAIYSDYGNPKGQVMMSLETLETYASDLQQGSYAIRLEPSRTPEFVKELTQRFGLSETQALDQQAIKAYSLQLFERTFAATQALNLLVLGVAAIALFSSLLTLSSMRLSQIAPIWACGVSRRQLVTIEMFRLLLIALLTALFAIPLGLIISYCLVSVINVRAFGWALPWQIFPQQWLYLTLAALFSAFLAAILPVLKLQFSSPSELLKGFRDDQ